MILNPTHIKSKTERWSTKFLESILTVFPKEIRPQYIDPTNTQQVISIQRAIIMEITNRAIDLYNTIEESLLTRKVIYNHNNISMKTPRRSSLQVTYLGREGKKRQILNDGRMIKEIETQLSIPVKTVFFKRKVTYKETA